MTSITVVAAAVRVLASPGDLHFDEIYSLGIARAYPSPRDVLTRIHVDNNHYLTTMWLALLGDNSPVILYRLPALLFGIAIVPLGAIAASRNRAADAVFTALMLGSSFLLIEYSTEARGYTPAVALAFVSWMVARNWLANKSAGWGLLFWLAVVTGLLCQLVFLHFYMGLVLLTCWQLMKMRMSWFVTLGRVLMLHGVPLLAIALIYFYDVRHMEVLGGQQFDALWLLLRVFSFALGGPSTGPLSVFFAAASVTVLVKGIGLLKRRNDGELILYVVALLVAPLVSVLLIRSSYLYARYFLVGITLSLCLTGQSLAELWRRNYGGRILATVLAGIVVISNASHTQPLLAYGRGGYSAALRAIARETSSNTIIASTDHDFRHGLVMGFHSRELPDNKQVVLIVRLPESSRLRLENLLPKDSQIVFTTHNETLPEWYIAHRTNALWAMTPNVTLSGTRYELVNQFPHGSLSGWDVFTYRRSSRVAK